MRPLANRYWRSDMITLNTQRNLLVILTLLFATLFVSSLLTETKHTIPSKSNFTTEKKDPIFFGNIKNQQFAEIPNTEAPASVKHNESASVNLEEDQTLSQPFSIPVEAAPAYDITSEDTTSMDAVFALEHYDDEWAAAMEYEISEKFSMSRLKNSVLESVECRETLCRISIEHGSEDALDAFYTKLIAQINDQTGHIHSNINENGHLVTTIYQYRKN